MFHYGDQSGYLFPVTADETDSMRWLIMTFKALPTFDFQQNCSHKQPGLYSVPCTCFCLCHNHEAVNSLSVWGGKLKLTIHLDVRRHLIECSAEICGRVCARVCVLSCMLLSFCLHCCDWIINTWQMTAILNGTFFSTSIKYKQCLCVSICASSDATGAERCF